VAAGFALAGLLATRVVPGGRIPTCRSHTSYSVATSARSLHHGPMPRTAPGADRDTNVRPAPGH
jgi:hypothetical protein